jgi:hypothetical protein
MLAAAAAVLGQPFHLRVQVALAVVAVVVEVVLVPLGPLIEAPVAVAVILVLEQDKVAVEQVAFVLLLQQLAVVVL